MGEQYVCALSPLAKERIAEVWPCCLISRMSKKHKQLCNKMKWCLCVVCSTVLNSENDSNLFEVLLDFDKQDPN